MNRLIRTLKTYDLATPILISGLTLAIVSTALVQQRVGAESETGKSSAIGMAVPVDETDLGIVIADQGNAALRQIREEQRRAALANMRPTLPPASDVDPELVASAD